MNKTQEKLKNINMLNDAMFKALFRSIEAREMVSNFLSELTGIDKEILMNADYQGGELIKKKLDEKGKTSDIIIKIDRHNKIILEMNQYLTDYIFEKNVSYVFSIASETILSGSKNYPNVIMISFDNFNKYKTDKPILEFKLRDQYGNIETNQYHSIHLIIENIINSKYNINKETKKLISLLKKKTVNEMEKEFKGDDTYMAAIRKVEDLSTDPDFVGYYDIEEARKQENWEFKQTGIREGFEQGVKEKQIEIAKNLLSLDIDIEDISVATGLSIEEINNL